MMYFVMMFADGKTMLRNAQISVYSLCSNNYIKNLFHHSFELQKNGEAKKTAKGE